jgi:TRAP-type C4-dicarboxylate transport system substrate-binding protein
MKLHVKSFFFGLLLILTIVMVSPMSVGAASKTIKWKMAIPYPPGTQFQTIFESFGTNIKRMSNNRLQLEIINAGAGIGPMEFLNSVSNGIIESALVYPPLHQGQIPFGVVEVGLPGGPDSLDKLRSLQMQGWSDVLSAAYAKHGVHWLPSAPQISVYLLTKAPIKNLDDMKRLKVRAVGSYGKMMRALGSAPVVISYAEIYTSLATGVIDGWAGSNLIEFSDSKAYEVAKYLYPLRVSGLQSAPIIINTDVWNNLSDDLKAIVEAANILFGEQMRSQCLVWEGEAEKELMSKGVQWSPAPSAEDKAKWALASEKVWEEFAAKDPVSAQLIEIQRQFMKGNQ